MLTHHDVPVFARMLTRHVVLETSHVKKMFLTFALLLTAEASLGGACGAGCGAAAAFRKKSTPVLLFLSIFLYAEILPLC